MNTLRSLPSVDHLLQTSEVEAWIQTYGRPLTLDAIRIVMQDIREAHQAEQPIPGQAEILARIHHQLENWVAPSLYPLINATGVVLHTNLGRAPLSPATIEAMRLVAGQYSNLEYDLQKGARGSRLLHAEDLLKRLLGVEAALVVNNNAAGLLLALSALARKKGVLISRTQLVEIGGGFRVPEVMKQSGARLVEVGTTNRVHLADYQQALQEEEVALVLRAHRSNFRILGFTSEPSLAEMAEVAHAAGLPLVDDLGSGSLLDTARFGLGHEPMVQESLAAGADLVCFSGDKLLGGPQGGIIVGRKDLVDRLKKHPLARAVRADKIALAGLTATLLHYLKDEATSQIPIWQMIATPLEDLQQRAEAWIAQLGTGSVIAGQSTVGGGSLPGETLPTCLLALDVPSPNRFLARLRRCSPPVVARLENDQVVIDPRTVLPGQDQDLLNCLRDNLAARKERKR